MCPTVALGSRGCALVVVGLNVWLDAHGTEVVFRFHLGADQERDTG
jgi:hypothetical protein